MIILDLNYLSLDEYDHAHLDYFATLYSLLKNPQPVIFTNSYKKLIIEAINESFKFTNYETIRFDTKVLEDLDININVYDDISKRQKYLEKIIQNNMSKNYYVFYQFDHSLEDINNIARTLKKNLIPLKTNRAQLVEVENCVVVHYDYLISLDYYLYDIMSLKNNNNKITSIILVDREYETLFADLINDLAEIPNPKSALDYLSLENTLIKYWLSLEKDERLKSLIELYHAENTIKND